ncbi:PAS domain-containing protein [Phaeodactylibacter luteus]|uniref:histidine kinase n=1 Tax=Phaeodactylibacter luteus TaxID=1564516 RepID=A0A5C6S083_9BACT|nr:PAS domain-containing protein [Phaeodactylibacter luteus]TXB67931.1 PAS domain S-box protein [Phaeodactylibacter luteus]
MEKHYLERELYEKVLSDGAVRRFIEQSAPDGIWYWDLQQPEHEWMDARFWETLGYDPAQMPHSPEAWKDLVHPEDYQRLYAAVQQHLQDAAHPLKEEVRYLHRDGAYRWIRCYGIALRDEKGVPLRMLGGHQDVTAEQELRVSKSLLESLFDQDTGVILRYRLNTDGTDELLYMSRGGGVIWGITEERLADDWLGQLWQTVVPEDVEGFKKSIQHSAQLKTFWNHSWRIRVGTEVKWLEGRGIPRSQPDGSIVWDTLILDVSAQKSAAAELDQQAKMQEQLRQITARFINMPMEDVGAGIDQALGEIGRMVGAGRVYIFDYDFEAGTTSNLYEWCADGVSPEIENLQDVPLEAVPDWLEHHLAGLPMHIPNVPALPEGGLRDILEPQGIKSLLAVPMQHQTQCIGFMGLDSVESYHHYSGAELEFLQLSAQVFANILEHIRSRRELLESELRLQRLTANVPGAIFQIEQKTDGTFSLPFISEGIRKIRKGLTPARISKDPYALFDLINPEDREELKREILKSASRGRRLQADFRFQHESGSTIWLGISARPEQRSDGSTVWYGMAQDITLQKEMEEMKRKSEELTTRYSELEQFSYVASHDLQEPLRTISSFAGLLHRRYHELLDEDGREYLYYMTDAAKRMSQLIDSLLDYSRLGSNRVASTVVLPQLLQQVEQDLGGLIRDTDTVLIVGDLPSLTGYELELRLLFQNLIGNGIKFRSPGRSPVIRIGAERIPGYWKFSVSDNGIGIAKESLERVFKIFQRLHSRTAYEGTGIGLTHCKKIVELHFGRIWMESEIGEGTTVFFTLKV